MRREILPLQTLVVAAGLALSVSHAGSATFTFAEGQNGLNFTGSRGGPVLGPNGTGGPSFDGGAFVSSDIVNIIGVVSGGNDTVTFSFDSAFSVSLEDLGIGTLGFVQIWETGGVSQGRQNNINSTGPLFDGRLFSAGKYDLRMNNPESINAVYRVQLTGVPLPASALLLVSAIGVLGVSSRRRRSSPNRGSTVNVD